MSNNSNGNDSSDDDNNEYLHRKRQKTSNTQSKTNNLEGEINFEFNQITQLEINKSNDPPVSYNIPKPGGSKKQRLQKLLQEAEKKRQRYQQLAASDNPVDNAKLQSEQWNDILNSAAGKKTLLVSATNSNANDPQFISKSEIKIKKALKKIEKKKEKSAKEWQNRLDTLNEEKEEKLKKREENINKYKKHQISEPTPTTANTPTATTNKVKIGRPGQSNNNKSKHNNSDNHSTASGDSNSMSKKPNRAGFEGKKSDGKFLNAKN